MAQQQASQMIESIPTIMRIAGFESVSLLTMFVIANLSEAARSEFLSILRDQIARAQGRARFAAIRGLEERRDTNERLAELLSDMERAITAVLRGDVEDVITMSGLRDLIHTTVELCAEGEPPQGSLLL